MVDENTIKVKNIFDVEILEETSEKLTRSKLRQIKGMPEPKKRKPSRLSLPAKPVVKTVKRKGPLGKILEDFSPGLKKKIRHSLPVTIRENRSLITEDLSIDETARHWEMVVAEKLPAFSIAGLSKFKRLQIPRLVADYLKEVIRDHSLLSKLNTGALQKIPANFQANFLGWFTAEIEVEFCRFLSPFVFCANCSIQSEKLFSGECNDCFEYRKTHHLSRPYELYEAAAETFDDLCTNCYLFQRDQSTGICDACDAYESAFNISRPRASYERSASIKYGIDIKRFPTEAVVSSSSASGPSTCVSDPEFPSAKEVKRVPRKLCLNCNLQVAKYSDQCYACDHYERLNGNSRPARLYEAAALKRGTVFVPTPVPMCDNCKIQKQKKDESLCSACFNYQFKYGVVRPLEDIKADAIKRANYLTNSKGKEPERKSSHLTEYDDVFTDLLVDSLYLSFTTHKMNVEYVKKCKFLLIQIL